MNAGPMDRLIELRAPVSTRNTAGETVLTYPVATASVWARVRGSTAREQIRNGLTSAEAPYEIRIRYRTDVTEKWRIVHENRTLEISSIVEFGRRDGLDIVATELRE